MKQRIFASLIAALFVLSVGSVKDAQAGIIKITNKSSYRLTLVNNGTESPVTSTNGAWLHYPKTVLKKKKSTVAVVYMPLGAHAFTPLWQKIVYSVDRGPRSSVTIAKGAKFNPVTVLVTGSLKVTIEKKWYGLKAVIVNALPATFCGTVPQNSGPPAVPPKPDWCGTPPGSIKPHTPSPAADWGRIPVPSNLHVSGGETTTSESESAHLKTPAPGDDHASSETSTSESSYLK